MQEIQLSSALWGVIESHLPHYKISRQGGRPRLPLKKVFEGILFIKVNQLPWRAIPKAYGSKTALNDYFRHWKAEGVFDVLHEKGVLNHSEVYGYDISLF